MIMLWSQEPSFILCTGGFLISVYFTGKYIERILHECSWFIEFIKEFTRKSDKMWVIHTSHCSIATSSWRVGDWLLTGHCRLHWTSRKSDPASSCFRKVADQSTTRCLNYRQWTGQRSYLLRKKGFIQSSHWVTVFCRCKRFYPLLRTDSTQEDPSQHDWKIVDWVIKNQTKQNKLATNKISCKAVPSQLQALSDWGLRVCKNNIQPQVLGVNIYCLIGWY